MDPQEAGRQFRFEPIETGGMQQLPPIGQTQFDIVVRPTTATMSPSGTRSPRRDANARRDSLIAMQPALDRPWCHFALGSNDMLDSGAGLLATCENNLNQILDRLEPNAGEISLIAPTRLGPS